MKQFPCSSDFIHFFAKNIPFFYFYVHKKVCTSDSDCGEKEGCSGGATRACQPVILLESEELHATLRTFLTHVFNFAATGGQVQMDSESLNLVMMDKEEGGGGMGSNKDMGGGRSTEEEGG